MPAPATPSAPPGRVLLRAEFWRHTLRHYLQVLAFCFVVAVFTTLLWPGRTYGAQLVYSICIGTVTWAVIEFGRLLVPRRHCHGEDESGHGWPKGWRGVVLTLVGVLVGYYVGDCLAFLIVGPASASKEQGARDALIGLYITIAAGAVGSFYFYARGKAAAMAAQVAAAERDASEARLRLLQSQLEPHMLFNTLANLRALIGMDPAAAQLMVDRMNDYLRATLNASRATAHPLAAEFERLADYLELMAVRMGPRLSVTLELPEALREVPVPPLLLQPLVENAIQHGLEPRVEGGALRVRAWTEGDRLQLEVADTGVGFDPADVRPDRFGLTQVRERVATAYAGAGEVTWHSAPGAGTQVRLALPMVLSVAPAAP